MPYVSEFFPGIIVDEGISDVNNMGAAMAPAAAKTISGYFSDTITSAEDYRRMISETGCDGIAIGQGAMGNPWIFKQIRAALDGDIGYVPSVTELGAKLYSRGVTDILMMEGRIITASTMMAASRLAPSGTSNSFRMPGTSTIMPTRP